MDVQTKRITEGITLYMLPDDKFKNCMQGVYFTMPLRGETATGLALLPKLLSAGNSRYTNRSQLHMQAEAFYGTLFKASSGKAGERQVVSFVTDCIADRYAGEPLFDNVWALLQTVICEPRGTAAFEADVFNREKETHREDIRGAVNDKRRYALLRCIEEMCKGEAYGIRADGTEEELDKLTPASTFALYQKMLHSAQVDIFVCGAFHTEQAIRCADALASILGPRQVVKDTLKSHLPQNVRYVEDREPVQQGKLVIGYRADVNTCSDDYY